MSNQYFVEPFLITGEDGSALTNSTTATSILPSSRKFTLPAYYFDMIGKALRVRASGRISTVVTTPGTLTIDVKFGSVVVFSSGAMTLNTTAQTNVNWIYDSLLISRTIGAGTAATMFSQGAFRSHAVIGSPAPTAGGAGEHLLPYNAAPAVGTGFDATTSNVIDIVATWSVANASNSITLHSAMIEAIN